MKALKIIGLAVVIWGLSLFWPEINQALTQEVTLGLGLALGLASLVYSLVRHFQHRDNHDQPSALHFSRPASKALPR
jgi:hypothetical protein